MTKKIFPPFNLQNWIDENRHLLKPPIGNQVLYKENQDFMVMVVGGPNSRKDFHINKGEELFMQIEGEIELKLMLEPEDGLGNKKETTIKIKAGDMFLLPPDIPHSPRRGPNTIGLVLERYREAEESDGFQWYCGQCGNLVYETQIPVTDIVNQLPIVMDQFYNSLEKRTCNNCGSVIEKP